MKIRLHGTLQEIRQASEKRYEVLQVVSLSDTYKGGQSELYHVYVEVRF